MPKRKRESGSVGGDAEKLESLRTLQAKAKIHHGQNVLHRAFKTAKGFERQKLSRRHKNATSQKDHTAVARIDAEIEATKTLDLSKAASNYLAKSLLKIKAVAESPDRPSTLTLPPSQSSDPAVLNVIARLCNSNPVRDVLPKILSDVEQALGIERGPSTTNGTTRKSDARKDGQLKATTNAEHTSVQATTRKQPRNATSEDEDDFHASSGDDDNDEAQSLDSDDSAAFAAFDSRLASSSDESNPDQPFRPTFDARALLQAHGSDPSASDSDSLSSNHSSPQPKKGTRKPIPPSLSPSPSRSPSPPPTTKPKSSAFLPSLTMGGYISGSDSADDLSDAAPKKNRRGQRARRAIWEKKFGKEAKHVLSGDQGSGKGKGGGTRDGMREGEPRVVLSGGGGIWTRRQGRGHGERRWRGC